MNTEEEMGITPALTLVLWIGCLVVGGIRRRNAPPAPAPPKAQTLDVEITSDAAAPQVSGAPPTAAPTEMTPTPALPAPVAMPEFIEPTALPDLVQPRQSGPPPLEIHQLTYGQGDGDQPAPIYPLEAIDGHQQGVVVVRFTVGVSGRVESAAVQTPSPWPLLNQEAVRAVRETWRFPAGEKRIYEVSIDFELKH